MDQSSQLSLFVIKGICDAICAAHRLHSGTGFVSLSMRAPLVPGYISLISGAGLEKLQHRDGRLRGAVALNSIWSILGFKAVFLVLGPRPQEGGS